MAKTLNTRISLKYDIWENWSKTGQKDTTTGKGIYGDLKLNKGEIAFCEIPSSPTPAVTDPNGTTVQNPPHIMYKVGDGTKTFAQLPWGSAKAADVHSWAKEDLNAFNTRVNNLINGALNGEGAATIKGYVTETDFNEFKTTIENRVKAVEDRVKAIEDDYTTAAEAGTIAQGKVDALKGATDDTAGTATVYGALASAAAADAKAEQNKTDIAAINTAVSKLNDTYATDAEVEAIRSTLQGNIDAKVAQADYNVKVKALEDADTALANRVQPLETDVAQLKTASATHATKDELNTAVAGLKASGNDTADSETIAGAKAYADAAIDAAIDTFYNTYIENDSTALDTLKEVTEWLDANKDGAADIVSDITNLTNNKLNISDFNDFKSGDFKTVSDKAHEHANKALLATYTQTEANLADAVAKRHSHAADMVEVTPAMKTAWDKVSEKATQSDLNEAVNRIVELEKVDHSHTFVESELNKIVAGDVKKWNDEVTNGTNHRKDTTVHITAAERTKWDAVETKASQSDLNALTNEVTNIKNDYLKAADEFIINCGDSSTIIF